LRRGDWKIVQLEAGREGPAPDAWELYDLAEDVGETRNVAAQHPQQVREMAALFQQWRAPMILHPLLPGTMRGVRTLGLKKQFPSSKGLNEIMILE